LQKACNLMDWSFPLGQESNAQLIDALREAGLPEE